MEPNTNPDAGKPRADRNDRGKDDSRNIPKHLNKGDKSKGPSEGVPSHDIRDRFVTGNQSK